MNDIDLPRDNGCPQTCCLGCGAASHMFRSYCYQCKQLQDVRCKVRFYLDCGSTSFEVRYIDHYCNLIVEELSKYSTFKDKCRILFK